MKQLIECVKIIIFGKVQGVFFRYYAKKKAEGLDIKGFARNTYEGNVEIIAQGERNKLNKFIELMKSGPPNAKVEKIRVSRETQCGFEKFSIILD
jgi:acylphosphatase